MNLKEAEINTNSETIEKTARRNHGFDDQVSNEDLAIAFRKYNDLVQTQEGQKELLRLAGQEHDVIATNYLWGRYKQLITNVFWKYYVNGIDVKDKLDNHDDYSFAEDAWLLLNGRADEIKVSSVQKAFDPKKVKNGEDPATTIKGHGNPYKAFNPDKYSPDADLLNSFGWYYSKYLENLANKFVRIMMKRAKEISMETKIEDTGDTVELSSEDFSGESDEKIAIQQFYRILWAESSPKSPYNTIMKLRMQNKSPVEIGGILGKSHGYVRNKLQDCQKFLAAFEDGSYTPSANAKNRLDKLNMLKNSLKNPSADRETIKNLIKELGINSSEASVLLEKKLKKNLEKIQEDSAVATLESRRDFLKKYLVSLKDENPTSYKILIARILKDEDIPSIAKEFNLDVGMVRSRLEDCAKEFKGANSQAV